MQITWLASKAPGYSIAHNPKMFLEILPHVFHVEHCKYFPHPISVRILIIDLEWLVGK